MQEILLRQQRRDREAKTALALLEGGHAGAASAPRWETLPLPTGAAAAGVPRTAIGQDDGADDLIVLKRYRA